KDSMTVPPFTARVLRDVDEAGVPVVFTTGRPLRWVEPLREHIGAHGIAIVSNGAFTYDLHTDRAGRVHGIDPASGLEVAGRITRALPSAQLALEFPDGIRVTPEFARASQRDGAPCGDLPSLWTEPAIKLLVRDASVDGDELRDVVTAVVGEDATVTWSIPGLIEISAPGITKAHALQALCAERGIDASGVVAFGDMPNDIPMLAWAGTACAVDNAHESVRRIADHVIPSVHDEGVAHTLAALLAA
ncbi:MAG: HAD hydrolase family protein, partial [Microbacterium gubbeenense]